VPKTTVHAAAKIEKNNLTGASMRHAYKPWSKFSKNYRNIFFKKLTP